MKIRPVAAFVPFLVALAGCQPAADDAAEQAAPADNAAAAQSAAPIVAQADLAAADGAPRGLARVTGKAGGLVVNVQASGLAPGRYGLHVHSVGACDAPEFKTAGGHWNPTGTKHGFDNPAGPHRGDLPNLTIGADGKGIVDFALADAGADGLLDADGAAVVIHAGPDDLKTDPSGDSGARIACGVLRAP
jgi:Cu-Zn family superoxide dismutase